MKMIARGRDGRLATTVLAAIAMALPGTASPAQEASGAMTAEQAAAAPEAVSATDRAAPAALPATVPVNGAEKQQPLPQSSEPEAATRLDDVVVTSTKRATPVRKIAATVNVLSGEDLERRGVQGIDEIVQLVPGVNLTDDGTGGQAKRITIRGISTPLGANATAGTLLGDIPFSDPFVPKVQLDPNPFDMATVEVLKGPQGTLFGGTGLNGLIRYVPETPQLDGFRVKYYTQFLSYPGNGGSAWNYGAAVNAPFADHTAAVRVMAFRRGAPGFVDDNTRKPGKPDIDTLEQSGFRAGLAWLPAERWNVSLMATAQQTHMDDINYTNSQDGDLTRHDSPRPSPAFSKYLLGTLGITREFDWGDLMSQTSYVKKHFDAFLEASRAIGGLLPLLDGANTSDSHGITQEFRATSAPGDSPWKWLAGVFYYRLRLDDCSNLGVTEGLPLLGSLPQIPGLTSYCPGNEEVRGQIKLADLIGNVDLKETALFGEVTRKLGERWEATLGARGYQLESGGLITTGGADFVQQNMGIADVSREEGLKEHGISPKASIVFEPADGLRTYLTVSRGFRFGGPQITAPRSTVPAVYKSDSLWNYELGVRSDWLERTLRLDASAYYIDWDKPQVFEVTSDGLVNYIDNVGSAKGNGVELALAYKPPFAPGVSLDSGLSWNRTYTTASYESPSGVTVPSGSPWPLAPRWQTATTLAYAAPVRNWMAGASLRHVYLSQACNKIECTAQVFGYQTLNLNVFANPVGESYWPQLSVSLDNLTDERGRVMVAPISFPGNDAVTYIAPRTVVLRLSGNF